MLTILLLLPLAGALLVAVIPARRAAVLRPVAIAVSVATLAWACVLLAAFDPALPGPQLVESYRWNPRLGTSFTVAIDGFSLPMVLLGALLTVVALLASGGVRTGARLYFSLLLALEAAMLGVFVARDWSLFYVFWELTLIPLFFLIDRLGGPNRHPAALNFVLYTMGGSVFMLVALLFLYDAAPGHSFGMADMAAGAHQLAPHIQLAIFVGLLIGFGVKMPIFPMHGWLPLAHVEAPSPVSILLSGILLKMGSYGLIRAVEALPAAALAAQNWLAALAFINLVYGGVLAWRQRDLKAMVAYSSVSHMGVVLLGIATLNTVGLTGAVMQMVAHGLVAGALFLLVGLLYERTHSRDIADYGSLARSMPRFACFAVLAFLAAVGLPGTAGFIAELHALIGGFDRWGAWVVLLSLSVLVSAAYALRTIGQLTVGEPSAITAHAADMRRGEALAALLLAAGILTIGFFPAPALALVQTSVGALSRLFAS